MGKFNKTGKKEMPALNTSSLPDLIFTLLFFFMIVTTMREVTLKVEFKVPQATDILNRHKPLIAWEGNHLRIYKAVACTAFPIM